MDISQTTNSWYSMTFSQRLQTLRKKRGITQKALAQIAGTHMTQIQRYESGETQPTLDALRKLALGLNVSTDTLVFSERERDPGEDWRLQFEALAQFTNEEQEIAKVLIESLILRYTANRFTRSPVRKAS